MAPNATAGCPPVWRKVAYSSLAILSFLYPSITLILFYVRRKKISDIQYRPLRLNVLNVIAAIILCVMICLRTAFYPNEFPCILLNWPAYIGFFLYCSALTCRVISFSWVAKYNLAKLRLSSAYTPRQASFNFSNNSINSNSKSNNSKYNSNFNFISPPISPMSPGLKERLDFPGAKLMTRLKKFKNVKSDKWLVHWVICPMMVVAFTLALLAQLTTPNLSIPLSTNCDFGPIQYVPLSILNGTFLLVICPTLIFFLYDIRDAYGLRNELMVTLVSGVFSFIVYFVIELMLPRWENYFGSLMLLWFTFILCHSLSITTPVIQSFKYQSYPVPKSSARSAIKRSLSLKKNNIGGDGKSKRYIMFEKVLQDSELFECYKMHAAACFCPELVIFLQEYQFLKMLVFQSCTPSDKEIPPLPSPKVYITETGHISFSDNSEYNPTPSPSIITTPCTKSIAETVTAASWVPMPIELRTSYSTFYETFFDSESDLAINFPGSLLNHVKDMADKGNYELTMYEEAREEVLNLLYRNTFERFLKMYGPEVEKKGI